MKTQKQMFYDVSRKIGERDQLMQEFLFGENQITDDDLRKLIARRPEVYNRYEGYLGRRGKVRRFVIGDGWSAELINLYHLGRTALADKPFTEQSAYHRMRWAAKEFHKAHPAVSEARAYKELSRMRHDGGYKPLWVRALRSVSVGIGEPVGVVKP